MHNGTSTSLATRGTPPGVPPPAEPPAPSHERAESVRRHPSSYVHPGSGACRSCGYRPPATSEVPEALALLAPTWVRALADDPSRARLEAAARLRRELQAVADRVRRIITAPGSPVPATVELDATGVLAGSANPQQVLLRLRLAAQRTAELAQSLSDDEWRLHGTVGTASVRVEELLVMPLHRSHARLTKGSTCR